MAIKIMDKILRAGDSRYGKYLTSVVEKVNSYEKQIALLSDTELKEQSNKFKEKIASGAELDDLLPEAFATVREASKRLIGQRHYDVQIMGGVALHEGKIAEMKTGEGKTLVSTLPAYLNALSGNSVHIVTVNDYLASRDSAWMGQIHRFLGLKVGLLTPNLTNQERQEVYKSDIIYGTNSEFGFDYLRDNMTTAANEKVSGSRHFAIIDEIDSILIDEARTPLIISGQPEDSGNLYSQLALIAKKLTPNLDYVVDLSKNTITLTEAGEVKIEKELNIENLYSVENSYYLTYVNSAMKAKEIFRKDIEYIVKDNEVLIVDEHTGRIMDGRRFSDGIHQAIEAKEGVIVKEETSTLASITIQNYFRLYEKLSGMTGTAMTEESEFFHIYKLSVVVIPTNRNNIRLDDNDLIYMNKDAKYKAIIAEIKERHILGQPILVGTTSIENSEIISKLLLKNGVKHEVLNAKNHAKEAHIIARAGKLGAVTVATNMAGRGTDIILGGNPEIIVSEMISPNNDSPDDETLLKINEGIKEYIASTSKEREEILKLGGLYVLGTERHESRRIDNQLRGRSGRQGDIGRTKFYLSLEDEIMKRFPTGALTKFLGNKNLQEEALDNKIVSNSILRAQTQLESLNYEMRKEILKYDDVLNLQRKIIYETRDAYLENKNIDITQYVTAYLEELYNSINGMDFIENWDMLRLKKTLISIGILEEEIDQLFINPELNQEIFINNLRTLIIRNHEKKIPSGEQENFNKFICGIIISTIDKNWVEHMHEMDYLREGINLRANAQKDPLVEYKNEAHASFKNIENKIKIEAGTYIVGLKVILEEGKKLETNISNRKNNISPVSRNSSCPCGSGKKYKRCHGK